jgi:hypothetical protein
MMMLVENFMSIGVSSVAHIAYALGSAIKMTKLVCCVDTFFLTDGRRCVDDM